MRIDSIVLIAAVVGFGMAASGCGTGHDVSIAQTIDAFASAGPPASARPAARSAARSKTGDWLSLASEPLMGDFDKPIGAEEGDEDAPTNAATTQPTHWSKRRGPAYKGDWLHSFGRDAKELPATMWDDAKATFTSPVAWVGLGAAGISGIVINASGSDNRVADHYTKNGHQLNGFWDMVGDVGGNPGLHFAVAGAMYFSTIEMEDSRHYEISKALINALAVNGLTTVALKGIVRTRSPNGDPWGWPSGHTSSTFTLATVMHEAYGPWVGVPLFLFASYVGYERIDARNHDFSDVISGALMGVAIGHAVMQNHKPKILGFEVIPWGNPSSGSVGLALSRQW